MRSGGHTSPGVSVGVTGSSYQVCWIRPVWFALINLPREGMWQNALSSVEADFGGYSIVSAVYMLCIVSVAVRSSYRTVHEKRHVFRTQRGGFGKTGNDRGVVAELESRLFFGVVSRSGAPDVVCMCVYVCTSYW